MKKKKQDLDFLHVTLLIPTNSNVECGAMTCKFFDENKRYFDEIVAFVEEYKMEIHSRWVYLQSMIPSYVSFLLENLP